MQSFSHRLAVTAPDEAPARAPDFAAADRPTGIAASDALDPTDPFVGRAGGHDASEDVDFDTAIAEVLKTLAADQGQLGETRSASLRDAPIGIPPRFGREDVTSVYDQDHGDHEAAGSDDVALDPEALLAAEAATFRLLGELERLWHSAA